MCNGYTQIDPANAFTLTKVNSLPGTTQSTVTAYRPYYRNETVANATNASTAAACSGNAATATSAGKCTGNAATATTLKTSRSLWGKSFDGSANVSGDIKDVGNIWDAANGGYIGFFQKNGNAGRIKMGVLGLGASYSGLNLDATYKLVIAGHAYATGHWYGDGSHLDYAEMRNIPEAQINVREAKEGEIITYDDTYAGRCAKEVGDGTMTIANKRLEKGCKIISDTFGFCLGKTDGRQTPIAVSGRVLVYPYENIEIYKSHIGDCVCSGPEGTVSIMTDEEKIKYPECIVGTISEIPTYDIWTCKDQYEDPIQVNGRIWIYVR